MATPNSDALTAARENLVGARAGLVTEISRLQAGVDQIDAFLSTFGDVPAPVAPSPAATAAPAAAPTRRGRPKGSKNKPKAAVADAAPAAKGKGKRPRRGAITEAIIKYLDQRAPSAEHADQILDYLASVGAAPQSSNPKPTLQSTLNRLQAQGQVRNIGKNQWRRVRPTERTAGSDAPAASPAPASPAPAAAAPSSPAPTPAPAPSPAPAPAAPPRSTGEGIEQRLRSSSQPSAPSTPRFGGAPR